MQQYPPFARHDTVLSRVSRRQPCPICQHTDWCELRSDGAIHCMRVESPIPSLRGGGWWHNFPDQRSPEHAPAPSYKANNTDLTPAEPPPAIPIASPAERDRVYQSLLAICPLHTDHMRYLRAEGFHEPELRWYGSLDSKRALIGRELQRKYANGLLAAVPGFYIRADGQLAISAPDGLLVAVRDEEGRIIGMQVRVAERDGSKKYLWLSSASKAGPASGAPAAIAGPASAMVWVTEGAKKAHSAALALDCRVIGLPGHATQKEGLEALRRLADAGALCVVVALDEDSNPATAAAVDRSRRQLCRAGLSMGLAVRVARWDGDVAKGLDDLLRTGQVPELQIVTALAGDDPPAGPDGEGGCSCREAKKLRELRIILSGPLPDIEKLSCVGLALCLGERPQNKQTVWMDSVVDAVGLAAGRTAETARKRVGRALLNVAEWGFIERDASERNPENGHVHLSFAMDPAKLPARGVSLPVASRTHHERTRKHVCRHCGSSLLVIKCMSCGKVQEDALEQYVADGGMVPMADSYGDTLSQEAEATFTPTPYFRNPEVSNNPLLPDSGSGTPGGYTGQLPLLADPVLPDSAQLEASPLELVLAALKRERAPLPEDWLPGRTGLSRTEVHAALGIGLRNHLVRQLPPSSRNGAPCYAAASR